VDVNVKIQIFRKQNNQIYENHFETFTQNANPLVLKYHTRIKLQNKHPKLEEYPRIGITIQPFVHF
jgi:hypothetical protein